MGSSWLGWGPTVVTVESLLMSAAELVPSTNITSPPTLSTGVRFTQTITVGFSNPKVFPSFSDRERKHPHTKNNYSTAHTQLVVGKGEKKMEGSERKKKKKKRSRRSRSRAASDQGQGLMLRFRDRSVLSATTSLSLCRALRRRREEKLG
ncbi:hypothetical protein CDAR_468881 [Caerostris darwini]|uniref:Uncharacterized protein n=1 Tax=Caerostris darwini TaxID=1538125 RepID=A0AAV4R4K2_9ARAC|nr:hypothetical protein CDAR_468881 [Caerostris darwini]